MDKFYNYLQIKTEKILTKRKKQLYKKRLKQKNKHPVIDWLDAFLWAAVVVLLLNQYLVQAYQIPSGSMRQTLLEKDRIFVNKVVFGPELIPGLFKLSGFTAPVRSDVIIFENPEYISKGPGFDILQRILYMATLALVDIDKDENGNPKVHFLIKRMIGHHNDRIIQREGEIYIKPKGESEFMNETFFKEINNFSYGNKRLIHKDDYKIFNSFSIVSSMKKMGLNPSDKLLINASKYNSIKTIDYLERNYIFDKTEYEISPHKRETASNTIKFIKGWYIPEGWILPLGDNRDNSNDGRYFGPVKESKILGQAMFKYWPVSRIGAIR